MLLLFYAVVLATDKFGLWISKKCKLNILDCIIVMLKYVCNFNNKSSYIIVSIEKSVLKICNSILYSCKKCLSLSVRGKFKEFQSDYLLYL